MTQVFNRDCMEAMKEFPDKFFELAIVDPPYGVGDFAQEPRTNKPFNRDWEIKWNNEIPTHDYFNELIRVSKNQIIWGENYYKKYVTYPGTIVWDKGNNSGVGSSAELATTNLFVRVVMYYEKWTGFVNSENAKGFNKIHPCQKPIALYKWLLKNYAKEGDKILDTHLGSGSSRIAADQMGFDFWGYELDKDYFEASVKRFNQYKAQTVLF